MAREDRSYIRTKAMAVLLSADRTQHAVIRYAGTSTEPEPFHRLVGGSVGLGERSVEAVVREIGEELGTALRGSGDLLRSLAASLAAGQAD